MKQRMGLLGILNACWCNKIEDSREWEANRNEGLRSVLWGNLTG